MSRALVVVVEDIKLIMFQECVLKNALFATEQEKHVVILAMVIIDVIIAVGMVHFNVLSAKVMVLLFLIYMTKILG